MKNIKELYNFIESLNSFDYSSNHEIEKEFQLLSEKYIHSKYIQTCRWEMYFWTFYIEDGKFNPRSSWTTKDGEIIEYPSLKTDFNINALDYFKNRAESTGNEFLKARYNHFLWQSKSKHRKHAVNAIKSYLQIIDLTDKRDLREICKSLISISLEAKCETNYVLSEVNSLIQNKKIEIYDINQIANFLIENYKLKSIKTLLETIYYANTDYVDKSNLDDHYFPDLCDTSISVGHKLNLQVKNFYTKKAEYYLSLINEEKSFVKQNFYFEAIKAYESIGDRNKLDELYVLLENSKDEIRMGLINEEVSSLEVQSVFKAIESRAEKITNMESTQIYEYLATNEEILPKSKSYYEKSKNSFMDLFSTTSFDINKNFVSGESAKDSLNLYGMYLTNFSVYELFLIFKKGVIKGNISYNSLISFLMNKSWIGKKYSEKDYDGKEVYYNLIDTLAPSIFDFFTLFESTIKMKKSYNTSYILCSDSLTLKLEGLIRHFAKIIGCPTIVINKGKDGTRHRYIEEIVTHKRFKEYFNNEDVIFILYTLTNRGMNIRNDIAHSFFRYENYSASLIILLINIMLRLSKYNFNSKIKN